MPFSSVSEARERVDALQGRSDSYVQKWIDIFNGCVEDHGGDEKGDDHNCFAVASSQAGGD